MAETLSSATPKMKAKAMPKQSATYSSNKAPEPAASSSDAQPGEVRGPKAKAAPKATTKPGQTRGHTAEPKREWMLGHQHSSDC